MVVEIGEPMIIAAIVSAVVGIAILTVKGVCYRALQMAQKYPSQQFRKTAAGIW